MTQAHPSAVVNRNRFRIWFLAIAVTGFLADLGTKELALRHLANRPQPPSFFAGWLSFPVVANPGAAFSMGTSLTWVFTLLALVAFFGLIIFGLVRLSSWFPTVVCGLLLAGVSGNLADRLFREPGFFHGHVIDFISVKHFAVFNVADVWISVAAGLLVILVIAESCRAGRGSDQGNQVSS